MGPHAKPMRMVRYNRNRCGLWYPKGNNIIISSDVTSDETLFQEEIFYKRKEIEENAEYHQNPKNNENKEEIRTENRTMDEEVCIERRNAVVDSKIAINLPKSYDDYELIVAYYPQTRILRATKLSRSLKNGGKQSNKNKIPTKSVELL